MQLKLTNVRLSFPQLFQPKSVNNSEPKYGASFLLDKETDAEQIKTIRFAIKSLITEKWPTNTPKGVKVCLHEGSEKEYDGYDDSTMFVSASSAKRPHVVDQARSPLAEGDGIPYAGCYVNCVVRLWVQDNQYGKRVNAALEGVQFARDGEPFGAPAFNPDEHFDASSPVNGQPKPPVAKIERLFPKSTSVVTEPDESEIPF